VNGLLPTAKLAWKLQAWPLSTSYEQQETWDEGSSPSEALLRSHVPAFQLNYAATFRMPAFHL
jgi:hypothetical protein